MPIKFLLLGGVLGFFRRGGGSANFIFMGVGIFRTMDGPDFARAAGRTKNISKSDRFRELPCNTVFKISPGPQIEGRFV